MTKKELQALKQTYSNKIFDTWYGFYKMTVAKTKENEDRYSHKLYIEFAIEELLRTLKINPEELLSENERDYIQKIAKEVATK